ncbi:MAG: GTP-binding protein, partial [Meiothermus silvanus]|nr:GTP-binding protein [Allomeiothermus silvanus]
ARRRDAARFFLHRRARARIGRSIEGSMPAANPFIVRRAAVLGAGVMGAQIAAHLVNANVPALLYELPAAEGDPNGNVLRAIENLKKLDPSPLATPSKAASIEPANYAQHLERLRECDLVIEAIAERADLKAELYRKIAPFVGERAVLATNTSGLSINRLAQSLPEPLRRRFCGVHFFNPPRYMHLVELIPAQATAPAILDALEGFLVTTLGKGVIRAKGWVKFVDQAPVAFSQAGKQIVLEPRIELLPEHELQALPQEEQAHYWAMLDAIQQEPTEMVFIGQGLLRQQREIIQQLDACLG